LIGEINKLTRGIMKTKKLFLLMGLLFISCNNNLTDESLNSLDAEYVLPYPVGKSYYCFQGFNSTYSHYGTFKYAIDFDMPNRTLITAARAGRVVYVVANYPNDDHIIGHENVVIIAHEDSTYARYSHLTTNGALVSIGQQVMPGDTIALSGNSGESSHPHLHIDVTKTFTGRDDMTIPYDFKNANPRPVGLNAGIYYRALSY
jgi:murein DD-endopeptidase MepM/ murein hydrolase activator NlpD